MSRLELDQTRKPTSQRLVVVGIGVSAGGLSALEELIASLSPGTGMAFVVVPHLSPDFKSMLRELLAAKTELAVETAVDRVPVKADTVYVLPPGKQMVIADGRLLLADRERQGDSQLPIDRFFRSLAKEHGHYAVAVILSGTGADGSRGILDIRREGGMTVAQPADSEEFAEMPQHALESGAVKHVGSPKTIASTLKQHAAELLNTELDDRDPSGEEPFGSFSPSEQALLDRLRERHAIDFRAYKPSVIHRRIEARAKLVCQGDRERYARDVLADPEELDQLHRDLLIGVTEFFRDPASFDALADEAIEAVLREFPEGETFRVWVAGCASGEEAYSLAIRIDEVARQLNRDVPIKVFATDAHVKSIEFAQEGIFERESLERVSESRLQHYFRPFRDRYKVSPQLRSMLVFAKHDLLNDPPFTRMNLISCRNLLIYLLPQTKRRVLSLLHFALQPRGVLFLGPSEAVGELSEEFDCIHPHAKVYTKRRDVRLRTEFPTLWQVPASKPENNQSQKDSELEQVINGCLPPTVLVDDRLMVQRLFAGAGIYLHNDDGVRTNDLLELLPVGLRPVVSNLAQEARTKSSRAISKNHPINIDGTSKRIDVSVVPLHGEGQPERYAVCFLESDRAVIEQTSPADEPDSEPRRQTSALERELDETRLELRAALENSYASNRAMQMAYEKLKAANEELQGTNEELQSVNEELFSVNTEYQSTIEELTQLSNDIENLLLSVDAQTLFLDRELRVRKFTPKIAEIFHLVGDDVRRPIESFAHDLSFDGLVDRMREVLASETVFQREVQNRTGESFLMRILPYRAGAKTDGVVLTLTNITSLVESQRQTLEAAQRFERAIAASTDGIWDWPDIKTDKMWWSPACYELLGYEPGEFPSTFQEWLKQIHPVDRQLIRNSIVSASERQGIDLLRDFEYRMKHKSGEYRWYRQHTLVDRDEVGKPVRLTGSVRDIHQRKRAELQADNEIQQWDNFLSMLSHELRNPMAAVMGAIDLLGQEDAEVSTGESDFETCELLAVIRRQVDQMSHRLDDLLEFASIRQNRSPLKKSKVDLANLSQEVLIGAQPQIEAKHQNLDVSVPDAPVIALVDRGRLVQAQVILLENASKHSPDYEDVHYELTVEADHAVISVRDHGGGIAGEELESIFDPFSRMDESGEEDQEASDVGLSMVRSIVQAHGGSIQAGSDGLDKGTVFTIRLPLFQGDQTPVTVQASKSAGSPRRSGRLMIVEDNVDVARMLDGVMSRAGFEVACAIDGYEAVELFDDFQPAVAVVDIGLPGMNGYELARSLRKRPGGDSVFLIAVTGYGMACDRAESEASGFDRHLVKPVNNDHLLSVIEGFFSTRSKK